MNRIRQIFYGQLPGLKAAQITFPTSAASVYPLLEKAHFVQVIQCDAQIAEELRRYAYRSKPFTTSLINLRLPKEELWKRMDRLCHRQIKKAQDLGMNVLSNQEQEAAFRLINEHIERARFRTPINANEQREFVPENGYDIFLCKCGGEPVAARVVLVQPDIARARECLSATADRHDPRFRNVVGPANRFLLWTALMHYQDKGLRHYDLGGLDLDPKSPFYPIAEFKQSFGGDVVQEYVLALSRHWLLRVIFGAGLAARRGLKRALLYPLALRNFHQLPVAFRRLLKGSEDSAKGEKVD